MNQSNVQESQRKSIQTWAFPWNAPRPAIASPFPTYDELHQREREYEALAGAQALLQKQAVIVRMDVTRRANQLEKEQGIQRANAFLAKTFVDRILPRVNLVSARYHIPEMTADTAQLMWRFNHLPDMARCDIELLAQDLASFVCLELGTINQEMADCGDLKVAHALYVRAGTITQAFRQNAPHWDKLIYRFFWAPRKTSDSINDGKKNDSRIR